MNRNQFETDDWGLGNSEFGFGNWPRGIGATHHSAIRNQKSAFTLTELLVVITIIAILAGLITGAAINALNRAKQAAITLEIQQLDGSLEDFKNTYGAYPPNAMVPESPVPLINFTGATISVFVESDFERMFRKAFPRHREPRGLIVHLAGNRISGLPGDPGDLPGGMTAAEAMVFWLGGFSSDVQNPLSGPGGPSFAEASLTGEVLEDRNRRYDFDLGRLGPRDADGQFDAINGRFIIYTATNGVLRRINFWQYVPSGSQQPLVYFDTSRHDPIDYDVSLLRPAVSPEIHGIKALREGLSAPSNMSDIIFVNKGTFQILHPGLDDIWGEESFERFSLHDSGGDYRNVLRFPTGPFLNDIADTVGNFITGTLADEQE